MYVCLNINIDSEGDHFGSTEAEAKVIIAAYLRSIADGIEALEESGFAGVLSDEETGTHIGRADLEIIGRG